jgi:vanillate O-demethylase ferredoxin subunit
MSDTAFEVLVHATNYEARGVHSFELRAPDGAALPPFTAGGHIDVNLPNGLTRSYSLVNSQAETHRYVIAVSLDRNSTGGSKYMFEHPLVGETLKISPPRNNFALIEEADSVVLIAGGIGITPLHSMILRLEKLGKNWALHYGVRDRASAAFREEFEALETAHPGRVHFNFDAEDGRMLDVEAVAAAAPANAHLYCCGPGPMLDIYKAATASRASETVHWEYFAAPPVPSATSGESFTVELSSTGETYEVGPGESILAVLLDNGVHAPSNCRAGMCGECLVEVLEGEPDHNDCVLSERERASNGLMMICVSGSKSKKLVIDL